MYKAHSKSTMLSMVKYGVWYSRPQQPWDIPNTIPKGGDMGSRSVLFQHNLKWQSRRCRYNDAMFVCRGHGGLPPK